MSASAVPRTCGSIALSGTSAVLTVTSPSIYFPGDFTIECWANADAATGSSEYIYPRIFSLYPAGAASISVSDLDVTFVVGTLALLHHGWESSVTGPYPGAGQWAHYAVTRAGSTLSFFVQGVLAGSVIVSGDIGSPTSVLRIGGYDPVFTWNSQWQGSIADFRVVQGAALYT